LSGIAVSLIRNETGIEEYATNTFFAKYSSPLQIIDLNKSHKKKRPQTGAAHHNIS
jgi:hypothetical protein